jgi:hypothetical protein
VSHLRALHSSGSSTNGSCADSAWVTEIGGSLPGPIPIHDNEQEMISLESKLTCMPAGHLSLTSSLCPTSAPMIHRQDCTSSSGCILVQKASGHTAVNVAAHKGSAKQEEEVLTHADMRKALGRFGR